VDKGLDAVRGEMVEKAIARVGAHDEEVIHVAGITLGRHDDRRAGERVSVLCRPVAAGRGPFPQEGQPRA